MRTARAVAWFALLASGAWTASVYLLPEETDSEPRPRSLRELARVILPSASDPTTAPLPAILAATTPPPLEPPPSLDPTPARPAPGAVTRTDHPIEDPSGHALEAFYRALDATRRDGATDLVRVVHYGDSMLTGDGISHAVRRALQARFGDGGHGFVLVGRPWRWYRHHGYREWTSPGVRINRITANPVPDGRFGLGGVAFRTFQGGARFVVEAEEGGSDQTFTLFYQAEPRAGSLSMRLDDGPPLRIDAGAPEPVSRVATLVAPEPGAHRVEIAYTGGGEIRLYGVAAERPGPGVVWDALGVNGLHASNFQRFDAAHLAEQIALRAPALIVVMLGTNESQNPNLRMERHGTDYLDMLGLLRRGAPEASCLVVSPPDRARRRRTRGRSLIARIVGRQRAVAAEAGCGFWSTFDAMGGEGSAERWRRMQPPLIGGDSTHPTPAGAEVIGRRLAEALLAGYDAWRSNQPAED